MSMTANLTFQFIANACGIFTGKDGTRILCDPWLDDGVFEGSWCHFPPLKTTMADVQDVDAIYVSHLHPDHFDERYFDFAKDKPLLVLDHGPNFLVRKLEMLGYTNLIKIKTGETVEFREFQVTLFAPFTGHNFHDVKIGNLIDSALVLDCDGTVAFNANDNTPTVASCEMLRERFGQVSLAMLNYNAAGPYPSCFDNLSEDEKKSEHRRILDRNFNHVRKLLTALKPQHVLPFAGAYVLGGDLRHKNAYLGTTTWDECGAFLKTQDIGGADVVLLREGDTLDLGTGQSDRPYEPIDTEAMQAYIDGPLASLEYPHQLEEAPDGDTLLADVEAASDAMKGRMERFGISSDFSVQLKVGGDYYQIYPSFASAADMPAPAKKMECVMDERLLRRILDRKAHWNNAEIGAHISFNRVPNDFELDLHMGLQFFHL